MLTKEKRRELEILALKIRIATLEALKSRGFGHAGGSLSIADILAVLYGEVMNASSKDPLREDRDKLVCSKGHSGPGVYGALAVMGYFPYEELKTLNRPGTHLPSHCDRLLTPGIDMTTGSLGQGTSLAVGIALGDKLKGLGSKTYLIVGDGESDEGQVWEAAMFTAAKKVTNLVWIIDNNRKQLDGMTSDVLETFDLRAKFEAFGFDAVRIDGHDIDHIYDALSRPVADKPLCIVLDTVKGKGIKEVEETANNHSIDKPAEVWEGWHQALKDRLNELMGREV